MVAAQFAVTVHVPAPVSIVTVAPALFGVPVTATTEQTPVVPVMVGITDAFVVAVTVNVPL